MTQMLQPPCPPDQADDFLSNPTPGVIKTISSLPAGPVMVLGAGGKMGLHLCLMLRKGVLASGRADVPVIAVSRFTHLRGREVFHAAGIETIACDLSHEEAVKALPDAPTVFFLAGVKFGTANSPELLEQMNVRMPQLVAERYRNSRIVAFSTGCVYPFADVNSRGATESVPPNPPGEYAQSCLRREQAFAAVSQKHGTPVALIRLNYSVEFRYGVLVDIATKVRAGEPVDVSTGHVNVIWQGDAVAHIIQALTVAASPAFPINITGPEVLQVRELANDFGKLFGTEALVTGAEAPTAWLNDASYSHKLFGTPDIDLPTMERWIAGWLTTAGETWDKPTGFEKRDGKF